MTCEFCLSDRFDPGFLVKSQVASKTVSYRICSRCKSIAQDPIPDQETIEKYYESYFQIKQEINPGYLTSGNMDAFKQERIKTLTEIGIDMSRIRLGHNVEIGCANGQFLRFLKDLGAQEITGIDISRDLINSIRIEGVKLIHGDLSLLKNNSIDILYLFNIIEHMPSIRTLFDLIRTKVKEDGIIVIEVPLAGLVSSLFGEKWRFLMPDEHLHIPSVTGLKKLLSDYRLKIQSFTRFGSGLTTGMTHPVLKRILDGTAKRFKAGDRGAFLCTFHR